MVQAFGYDCVCGRGWDPSVCVGHAVTSRHPVLRRFRAPLLPPPLLKSTAVRQGLLVAKGGEFAVHGWRRVGAAEITRLAPIHCEQIVCATCMMDDQPQLFRDLSALTKDVISVPGTGRRAATEYRVVEGLIPEDLKCCLVEPFSEDEILEIYHSADLFVAETDHEKPAALWLIGPPAVGKSTMSHEIGNHIFGRTNNAVTVDGSEFRAIHKGFQMVVHHGVRNKLLHADAWKRFKDTGFMDKLKTDIMERAVQKRQHLRILEVGLSAKRVHKMLERMISAGYELHAVFLWAPKVETEKRGRPRSVKEGKLFDTETYGIAVKSCLALARLWRQKIAEGDPHFKSCAFYDSTVFPSQIVHFSEFELLAEMDDARAEQHSLQLNLAKKLHQEKSIAGSIHRARTSSSMHHFGHEPSVPRSVSDLFLDARCAAQKRGRAEGFLLGVALTTLASVLLARLARQRC